MCPLYRWINWSGRYLGTPSGLQLVEPPIKSNHSNLLETERILLHCLPSGHDKTDVPGKYAAGRLLAGS